MTDLVEVVLVQLSHEARKVRVVEDAREYIHLERVHIFDDEVIAAGTPFTRQHQSLKVER